MTNIKRDLTVRLDEEHGQLVFFTTKRSEGAVSVAGGEPEFTVEISLADLKSRGADDAEKLIGSSVLGFFDHLTAGRLDLPKHYLDD